MKINRTELITALEAMQPGIAKKEVVEQSASFAFQNGRVYAYNDQIAVSHPCPKGLAGAVRAQEFHTLLKRLTDDEIDVEVSANELLVPEWENSKGTLKEIARARELNIPVYNSLDELKAGLPNA